MFLTMPQAKSITPTIAMALSLMMAFPASVALAFLLNPHTVHAIRYGIRIHTTGLSMNAS